MSAILRIGLLSALLLAGCSSQSEVATPPKQHQGTGAETTDSSEISDSTPTIEASPDDDAPGIAVGVKAPEFSLKNQANEDVSLSKLLDERNVAIVFYRSADW